MSAEPGATEVRARSPGSRHRSQRAGRMPVGGHRRAALAGLTLAALGVVFGDIGTSPLYAIQTVFAIDNGAVQPTRGDVYGVICWCSGRSR